MVPSEADFPLPTYPYEPLVKLDESLLEWMVLQQCSAAISCSQHNLQALAVCPLHSGSNSWHGDLVLHAFGVQLHHGQNTVLFPS